MAKYRIEHGQLVMVDDDFATQKQEAYPSAGEQQQPGQKPQEQQAAPQGEFAADKAANYGTNAEPAQPAATPSAPATSAPSVPSTPQSVANNHAPAATDPLQQAFLQQEQTLQPQLDSFRDLLDYYKHETPEEKERREKRQRITAGLTSAMDMVGALGNLGYAAVPKDGRSVKMDTVTDDVMKGNEIANNRIKEHNAKNIELRNRYFALRKAMADQKVSNAWNKYIQDAKDAQAKRKLDIEEAKARFDQWQKQQDLALKGKAAEQRDRDLDIKQQSVNGRNNYYDWKKTGGGGRSGGGSSQTYSLPVGKNKEGKRQYIEIPYKISKESPLAGALQQLLPQSYINYLRNKKNNLAQGADPNAMFGTDNKSMSVAQLMAIVGNFLNDDDRAKHGARMVNKPIGKNTASIGEWENYEPEAEEARKYQEAYDAILEVLKKAGAEFSVEEKSSNPKFEDEDDDDEDSPLYDNVVENIDKTFPIDPKYRF